MKLTALIVEDEPLAARRLADMLARQPEPVHILGTAEAVSQAVQLLEAGPAPDVLFLDIHLADGLSFEIFEQTTVRCPVIFTTAYDQYAVQSYTLNAADYLLKPIAFDRFLQAVSKVRQLVPSNPTAVAAPAAIAPEAPAAALAPAPADAMFVKNEHRLQRVAFDDILYIEGMKEYLLLHTASAGKILTLQSFRRVEEVLPPERFARIHKSFMVALSRIEHVERGKVQVAGRLLPVGDTYRESFAELIRAHNQL